MGYLRLRLLLIAAISIPSAGCDVSMPFSATVGPPKGTTVSDYFDEAAVVDLCRSVDMNDIQAMAALAPSKEVVNAVGKNGMTPLMWAMLSEKNDAFEWLLRNGADPNVRMTEPLDAVPPVLAGDSVMSWSAKRNLERLRMVLDYGGDPNLTDGKGDPPLHALIKRGGADRKERMELLLSRGADIDGVEAMGATPAMTAATWSAQLEMVEWCIDAGADVRLYRRDAHQKLIHYLVDYRDVPLPPEKEKQLQELLVRLEQFGESIDAAQADLDRWNEELATLPLSEYARRRRTEVEERKKREAEK